MTTTTTTAPIEWFHQFYNPNPSTTTPGSRPSDSTVVSTTITTSTPPPLNSSTTVDFSLAQLGMDGLGFGSDSFVGSSCTTATSPCNASITASNTVASAAAAPRLSQAQEGRVSKPARRRSRASRKNPTTLLNTDANNFRAMVQRYTGGANTYSAAGLNVGGGLHQGQMYNFNRHGSAILGMHYPSSAAINLQADHLQQQLLQQYSAAFSSTGNINAGSATSRALDHRVFGLGVEEDGVSSLSHVGAPVGPGSI